MLLVSKNRSSIVELILFLSLALFVFFPNVFFGVKFNNLLLLTSLGCLYIFIFLFSENKFYDISLWSIVCGLLLFKLCYFYNVEGYRLSDTVRMLFYTSCFLLFLKFIYGRKQGFYNKYLIFFVLFQVFILICQIFMPELVSNFYDISKIGKTTSDYKQFRYTGTLFNPNTLGVFFVFCFSLIIKWEKRIYFYFFLFVLLFISGSRTGFIMALFSIFIYEFSYEFCWRRLLKGLLVWAVLLISIGLLLFHKYASSFYYFTQISVVIHDALSGEGWSAFNQVSSLMIRFKVWSELLSEWWGGGFLTIVLGLPDINYYRYADNSYLYLITKYGLSVGLIILYFLFIVFKALFKKYKGTENFSRLCLWVCFCLLSGLFSDILVSYYFWIMMITFPLMVKNEKTKYNTCNL